MDAIYSFDYSILNYINEHFHNAFFDGFFSIITHLADAGWFWIALAALLLCFKKTRKTGCVMGAALLMGVIFGNGILKPLIHRVRPYDNAAWSPAVTRATLLISPPSDYSFPSGHTLPSFEGAFGIFLCNKKWGAPALVLAVLIAFSRLYFLHSLPDRCYRRYDTRHRLCRRSLLHCRSNLEQGDKKAAPQGLILRKQPDTGTFLEDIAI